jgi:hypothetical protein
MKQQGNALPAETSTAASNISSADFDSGYEAGEAAPGSLDAVLLNSPMMKMIRGMGEEQESLPVEDEEGDPTPDAADGEDTDADAAPEETADEEADQPDEESEEESDDESTAAAALPSEEQVEWSFKVPVKIDGKVQHVSLADLRKGYATDQHLSQKGREIGELKKAAETERAEKLASVIQLADVLNQELSAEEQAIAAQFTEVKAQHDKAKKAGDTFAARDARERMEELREEFGTKRQAREAKLAAVAQAYQKRAADEQQALLKKYQDEAPTLIQGYSEEVAAKCRDFALKEGVPEGLLDQIFDARVVKFINDYRLVKEAINKGSAKRKIVTSQPTKAVPVKKGTPPAIVASKNKQIQRARVLSGKGSAADELSFLKGISSIGSKL